MIPDIADRDWRPEIPGWSHDILPYYRFVLPTLPQFAAVVEVGVAHGRSLVFMVEELKRIHRDDVSVWGVDSWPDKWWNESMAKTLSRPELAELASRWVLIRDAEHRAVRRFADKSLDLVFIDSDHSEAGVNDSIALWLPKMKPAGVLAGHDYDPSGWPGVVAAVKSWETKLGPVGRPTRTCWEWRIQ